MHDVIENGLEYDIVMKSESRSIIILADAKFRDMSTTSLTGLKLIDQELLGKGGLREEAEKQHRKLVKF